VGPESPPKAEDSYKVVAKRNGKGRPVKDVKDVLPPTLDATVVRDAERLGYAASLRNLASRPEVIAIGVSARVMLEALKRSEGLVNPAKRAILGI